MPCFETEEVGKYKIITSINVPNETITTKEQSQKRRGYLLYVEYLIQIDSWYVIY